MPGSLRRLAVVGEGFFEFSRTSVSSSISSWRSRRRSCRGLWRREEFFRTGSCARDLRSARSSVGRQAESDAAGEAFEILNAAEFLAISPRRRFVAGDGLRRRGGRR